MRHVELVEEGAGLFGKLDHIKVKQDRIRQEAAAEAVWEVTRDVAAAFGYQSGGREA